MKPALVPDGFWMPQSKPSSIIHVLLMSTSSQTTYSLHKTLVSLYMIYLRNDNQKHQVMPLAVVHIMTTCSPAAIAPFLCSQLKLYVTLF